MGIVETNGVDFAVFQMTGSARRWWRDYILARPVGSPALTWEQFSQLFLEKFLPITLREDYRKQFERLQQDNMTVTQYESCFVDLARHDLLLLSTGGERVRRFIEGLTHPTRLQMAKETGSEISFQAAANVTRKVEMVLTQERGQRESRSYMHYSEQPAFGAYSAPISALPLQSYYSGYPAYLGQLQHQQPRHQDGCCECGNIGHIRRPAPVASLHAQPTRGRGQAARYGGRAIRGGGQAIRGGGQTVRGGGQPVRSRPRDTV
ncbi:uncharacterized protein [Nicotiana tomentosiformis]|uniref:uncharacterized protein n=1 Tax=Nicotiana tomentosiformis TaxID=4098 RepID=UPI00388CABF4